MTLDWKDSGTLGYLSCIQLMIHNGESAMQKLNFYDGEPEEV